MKNELISRQKKVYNSKVSQGDDGFHDFFLYENE